MSNVGSIFLCGGNGAGVGKDRLSAEIESLVRCHKARNPNVSLAEIRSAMLEAMVEIEYEVDEGVPRVRSMRDASRLEVERVWNVFWVGRIFKGRFPVISEIKRVFYEYYCLLNLLGDDRP